MCNQILYYKGLQLKTLLYTFIALIAFAGNSVLGRYALKGDAIDATSFTAIRLFSGAILLILLVAFKNRFKVNYSEGSWLSAFSLFLYALTFSYAYITLNTGVGALILFGTVQVTMVVMSIIKGKMLSKGEWIGLLIAFSGLTYLLLPSASAPSLYGFILMVISGIAWGFYTVAGKGARNPLVLTANNFLRTIPFVLITVLLLYMLNSEGLYITNSGLILAITSGAITSGLGYAIWYQALNGLSITHAAILQLTVPIIAAFGGVLFLSETISLQLIISAILVLGGIFVSLIVKKGSV